jgi:hypothetical protein
MGPGVCIYKLLSGNFNFSPISKSPWFWMGKKQGFHSKMDEGENVHTVHPIGIGVCVWG